MKTITNNKEQTKTGLEIAIVGLAGRFPGARNIEEFWDNMQNGIESIRFFSEQELEEADVPTELRNDPQFVNAKGYLENANKFDASFFGYSPQEAKVMDPQIRIFHEVCWEALEHAGYNPETYNGLIGVYAGSSPNMLWQASALLTGSDNGSEQFALSQLANRDYLSSRISYKMNLKGPSVHIQTACSTSLVAVHTATRALLTGECKIALAGGVSIGTPQVDGYVYQEGMIFSPDGHCRAFDANAQGAVAGEGAGVVVLKLLKHALAEGDTIHAVIKGSAINNDGVRKIGYTAPSIEGQSEVIKATHRFSKVDPESISYVETHGTGTIIGDPIEIEALRLAFNSTKKGFCAIGSVKTNIGHLDAAAGIAGLLKTVGALKRQILPPSLHYVKPNPKIDFVHSPFYVNNKLKSWETSSGIRRAGVSSFGIGGTNAHLILEEALQEAPSSNSRPYQILMLSANTKTALELSTRNMIQHLKSFPALPLPEVAYTLQVGRVARKYRQMLVCASPDEAIEEWEKWLSQKRSKSRSFINTDEQNSVVFLFPGQGSQYINMGAELYETESFFREEIDRCLNILKTLTGRDLKSILYPSTFEERELAEVEINRTQYIQPLIFTFEYALAKLLLNWGIKPTAMIGYSFGEYIAAHLAEVFSLEDALRLITERGRLMQEIPLGAMLSVPLTQEKILPFLPNDLSLSVDNDTSCIVSGSEERIEAFEALMKQYKVICMRVKSTVAGHSKLMEGILQPFEQIVRSIQFQPPTTPYISNATGRWITDAEATNPLYWVEHTIKTVRFADGVKILAKNPNTIFIEVGPGRDLTNLLGRFLNATENQQAVDLVRGASIEISDQLHLSQKIGLLWSLGVSVDWNAYYKEEKRKRIPLPTYPFERKTYQINIPKRTQLLNLSGEMKKEKKLDNYFYSPQWKRSISPEKQINSIEDWLFLIDESVGNSLINMAHEAGHKVTTVQIGEKFAMLASDKYYVRPDHPEDYDRLWTCLIQAGRFPRQIIHMWNLTDSVSFATSQQVGYFSLLAIAQSIGKIIHTEQVKLSVLTDRMQSISGEGGLHPEQATILGPVKVISKEYPLIICRSIDLALLDISNLNSHGQFLSNRSLKQLFSELNSEIHDIVIAYRGHQRFILSYDPISLPKYQSNVIRKNGVYLITGGLGAIGLILGGYLAEAYQATIILTTRFSFPERSFWGKWIDEHVENDSISHIIRKLFHWEELGSHVLVIQTDVTDEKQMKHLWEYVYNECGQVHGVIHTAGVADGAVISRRGIDYNDPVIESKITGTYMLGKLLVNSNVDFLMLCSSLAAIQGPFGQVAYTAANSFLDAYAHFKEYQDDLYIISINWDRWINTGIAIKAENLHRQLTGENLEGGINETEGVQSFLRVLNSGASQIAICSTDLQNTDEIRQQDEDDEQNINISLVSPADGHTRPELNSNYVFAENNSQQALVELWEYFFGICNIGIDDNFFELGGDSLKGIILISKIQKEIGVRLPLAVLFDLMTIRKISTYIEENYVNQTKVIANNSCIQQQKNSYIFDDIDESIINREIEEKDSIVDTYKLSAMQEMMLSHNIVAYGSGMDTYFFICKIEGKLDIKVFWEAWEHVISRHPILRTTFRWRRLPYPLQFVYKTVSLPFIEEDHSQLDTVEQIKELEHYIKAEKQRGFKVTEIPHIRLRIARLKAEQYELVWSYQNSLFDGWSQSILFKEVLTCYHAFLHQQPINLEKSSSFGNYINWLQQQNQSAAATFWEAELRDFQPIVPKPSQNLIADVKSAEERIWLTSENTKRLQKNSKNWGLTLNTLVLGCWAMVMREVEKSDDLLLGVVTAGRSADVEGIESMVGLFTNSLPLRVSFLAEQSRLNWFLRLQEKLVNITQYEHVTIEQVAKWGSVKVPVIQEAIYKKTFVFLNYPLETSVESISPDLNIRDIRIDGHVNVPLRIYVQPGEKLELCIQYDLNYYESKTVHQYLSHMIQLLEELIEM